MFHRYSVLFGLSAIFSLSSVIEVKAQLIPDNTLGKENSIVTPTKLLQRIDGGAIRGSNLFHSFKEFNINNGKSVYFSNPSAIENILTRVTGKNPSNIFGKLGVLGNANLFLLNPNGIIFGENTSLDISGSFSAITSPSILFNNNFEFSTTNPNNVPLLKVNITPGLQYPRNQQADITNRGNLTVGKDLNLIGKNLDLTGELNAGSDLRLQAEDTLKIRERKTLPFIADAGNNLLLQANQTLDIFALNHHQSGLFSGNNLILQSSNPVLGDARYFSGGSFRIEKLDGSLGDLESPNDPIIRASGDVSFDSYTGASLHILAGGSVNITGDVTITGADGENGLQETVTLSNGESLSIDGKNQATLDIRAGTTAFGIPGINGSGSFTPGNPNTGGSGSGSDIFVGGNIKVDAADGLVFLTNQYGADSSLSGGDIQVRDINTGSFSGNGGSIFIDSQGDIFTNSIASPSVSVSEASIGGNGGAITLTSGGSIFTEGAPLQTFSDKGNGGAITFTAGGDITINNTFLESNARSSGGDIRLNAENDIITNAPLYSNSAGNGGAITLNAGRNIYTNEKLDSSSSNEGNSGNGGAISLNADGNIYTQSLESFSFSSEGNAGNGGAIAVSAGGDILGEEAIFSTFSVSETGNSADGGNVTLEAQQNIQDLEVLTLSSDSISGDVQVKGSGDLSVTNTNILTSKQLTINSRFIGRKIVLDVGKDGQSGDVFVTSNGNLSFNNSRIASDTKGNNPAGDVTITSSNLLTFNNSFITINTNSTGSAGDIDISADRGIILTDKSELSAQTTAQGDAGDITLNTSKLTLQQQAQISTSTTAQGEAGDITINAKDSINLFNASGITSEAKGEGIAGELNITTGHFNIINGSRASVNSEKAAGNVTVSADNIILDNQAKLTSETNDGISGDIKLQNLKTLQLRGDSLISATTIDGEAGDIVINASDEVKIETDSKIASGAIGTGTAGFLEIITDKLIIKDNSQATVSSKGSGDAGYILVEANSVNLNNQAKIFATTDNGISGYISLNGLNSLILSNNSDISASTVDGEAGDITINAFDYVKIEGNSKLESAATGKGEAGFLEITTDNLTISDNSQATVSSKDSQNPGYILIEASDVNLINQAKISATTVSGISGYITLDNLNSLKLNNSEISASTVDGVAGDITINAANSIELTGKGGLSVQSTEGGIAGSIAVNTSQFSINDEAQVTVSSPSGQAGNLDITVNNLFLTKSVLTAETGVGDGSEGANITLDIKDLLLMRNNSLISAAAFDNANGGNITINNDQGFVIGLPFENSDIIANADKGNGGDIDITTQNIFGLVFREKNTAKSDITASSKFGLNGEVTVDQLNVNPASGLVELPSTLVGTTGIKAGCSASNGNNFVVSGKGGLPQSPDDLFSGNTTYTDLLDLVPTQQAASNISDKKSDVSIENQKNQIVEATGWIVDADGNVIFVAKMPEVNREQSGLSQVSCESFSKEN